MKNLLIILFCCASLASCKDELPEPAKPDKYDVYIKNTSDSLVQVMLNIREPGKTNVFVNKKTFINKNEWDTTITVKVGTYINCTVMGENCSSIAKYDGVEMIGQGDKNKFFEFTVINE